MRIFIVDGLHFNISHFTIYIRLRIKNMKSEMFAIACQDVEISSKKGAYLISETYFSLLHPFHFPLLLHPMCVFVLVFFGLLLATYIIIITHRRRRRDGNGLGDGAQVSASVQIKVARELAF